MKTAVVAFTIAITLTAVPCHAQVTCHCFKDRSFDPAKPEAADPYVLATTRNSFLAAAAGVSKGELVKMRMTGSAENDLWFSLYLARLTGSNPDALSGARKRTGSWPAALDALSLATDGLDPAFSEARKARSEEGMARALADNALRAFGGRPESVEALRKAGAGNAEAVLSMLLARRTGKDPLAVLSEVGAGRKSWGALLNEAGIAPDGIGDALSAAFTP